MKLLLLGILCLAFPPAIVLVAMWYLAKWMFSGTFFFFGVSE